MNRRSSVGRRHYFLKIFFIFIVVYLFILGVNLKGANLECSNMAGVNLRVATLKNANLQNCDLRAAVLAGADLEVKCARIPFSVKAKICCHYLSHPAYMVSSKSLIII